MAKVGVFVPRCDPCQFGRSAKQKLRNGDREKHPAPKKTGWITSTGALAQISKSESECPGNHVHAEMVED